MTSMNRRAVSELPTRKLCFDWREFPLGSVVETVTLRLAHFRSLPLLPFIVRHSTNAPYPYSSSAVSTVQSQQMATPLIKKQNETEKHNIYSIHTKTVNTIILFIKIQIGVGRKSFSYREIEFCFLVLFRSHPLSSDTLDWASLFYCLSKNFFISIYLKG